MTHRSTAAGRRRRRSRRPHGRLIAAFVVTGLVAAACTSTRSDDSVGGSSESTSPSDSSTRAPDTDRVPGDGVAIVGGVRLPAGQRIYARDSTGAATSGATAWLTEVPTMQAPATWRDLAAAFPTTGRWPVMTNGLRGDITRPWVQGETGPPSSVPELNLPQWLRARDTDDRTARYGPPLRGLAASGARVAPPYTTDFTWGLDIPTTVTTGLLLVPVGRPADVPAALGWAGAINTGVTGGELSAVLRSWEDQFGMTVTAVGFDTIDLHVVRPPTDPTDCRALAKEVVLVDPDLVANWTFDQVADAVCGADLLPLYWD